MRLTETELRKAACQVDFIAKLNKAVLKSGAYYDWDRVKDRTLQSFMEDYAHTGLRVNWNESANADDMPAPRFEDVPGILKYIDERDAPIYICPADKLKEDCPF